MQPFVFHNPTEIVFGVGTADKVGKYAARQGGKALLVYGRNSIKTTGLYERGNDIVAGRRFELGGTMVGSNPIRCSVTSVKGWLWPNGSRWMSLWPLVAVVSSMSRRPLPPGL